jgi:hypothetical protein
LLPIMNSCSRTRLARALMSSKPWPMNCASQLSDSLSPKKRYLLLLAAQNRVAGTVVSAALCASPRRSDSTLIW